jgi:hypothetical protein
LLVSGFTLQGKGVTGDDKEVDVLHLSHKPQAFLL